MTLKVLSTPNSFRGSVKMLLSELVADCHCTFLPLEGIVSLGMDGSEGALGEVWMQGWKCVPAHGSAYPQPHPVLCLGLSCCIVPTRGKFVSSNHTRVLL